MIKLTCSSADGSWHGWYTYKTFTHERVSMDVPASYVSIIDSVCLYPIYHFFPILYLFLIILPFLYTRVLIIPAAKNQDWRGATRHIPKQKSTLSVVSFSVHFLEVCWSTNVPARRSRITGIIYICDCICRFVLRANMSIIVNMCLYLDRNKCVVYSQTRYDTTHCL
jgi:hypothetical protein